jgi:hypothetical protein
LQLNPSCSEKYAHNVRSSADHGHHVRCMNRGHLIRMGLLSLLVGLLSSCSIAAAVVREDDIDTPSEKVRNNGTNAPQHMVWNAFVSGMVSGISSRAVSSLVLLPLDTLKVRQQKKPKSVPPDFTLPSPSASSSTTQPQGSNALLRPFSSLRSSSDDATASRGEERTGNLIIADLYRGWLPALLLAGPSTAVLLFSPLSVFVCHCCR